MKFKFAILALILFGAVFAAGFAIVSPLQAQFSGGDINNYRCPEFNTLTLVSDTPFKTPDGRFVCNYTREGSPAFIIRDAILIPPTLDVIQVWFVRITYTLWALSGIVFTALLIWIGFKYMTSFANQYDLGKIVQDFRKWLIGLALIFLSYPVLVTFFNVLPLSNTQCYEGIAMPGFQFFFPEACSTREIYCADLHGIPRDGTELAPNDPRIQRYLDCLNYLRD